MLEAPIITPTPRLRRHPLSYEAYLALPDESRLIEWVDGEVIYHMPPTPFHQDISLFLGMLLRLYVEQLDLGVVRVAPLEVKLWPGGPSREPDILYIGAEKMAQIGERRLEGAPDLIVEVVSPASVTLDRVTKFGEYERAGVGEYWIIDPRPFQQQVDFYVRDTAGRYAPAPLDDDGVYTSLIVPGFRLRPTWLWSTPLPNAQRILAELLADSPALSDELRAVYRQMLRL